MRLAVIGAGYWGPNLVRVFQQNNRVDSVVVCEIDGARRARVRTLFPTVELQSDLDTVLALLDREIVR